MELAGAEEGRVETDCSGMDDAEFCLGSDGDTAGWCLEMFSSVSSLSNFGGFFIVVAGFLGPCGFSCGCFVVYYEYLFWS